MGRRITFYLISTIFLISMLTSCGDISLLQRLEEIVSGADQPEAAPILEPPTTPSPSSMAKVVLFKPVFNWEDVTNAVGYHFQLGDSADFSNILLDETGLTESEFIPASNLSEGSTYFWRVATVNTDDVDGAWSTVWELQIVPADGYLSKYSGNPVFDVGTGTQWDASHVIFSSVLLINNEYKMWYTADYLNVHGIGYASSNDGITWTRYTGNPLMVCRTSGFFDDNQLGALCVLPEGSGYRMWYAGHDGARHRCGIATTNDNVTWDRSASNLVIDIGTSGAWDDSAIVSMSVLVKDNLYHSWYAADDGSGGRSIGYATSNDGETWTKHGSNPVFSGGASGAWDDSGTWYPTVLFFNDSYHMWFCGYSGSTWQIGYASSPDGISWVKSTNNPVLSIGPAADWDDLHVAMPSVVLKEGELQMWYRGDENASGITRFGYASF